MTLLATAPDLRRDAGATHPYDAALRTHAAGQGGDLWLAAAGGGCPLPLARWSAPSDCLEPADVMALEALRRAVPASAAVLDLDRGPGRHSGHLSDRGLTVLGVDTSRAAVALTRSRDVRALLIHGLGALRSRPGHASSRVDGGWDAFLLLDANIDIGGDALRLLCRVGELLTASGRLLVELTADCSTGTRTVRPTDVVRTSAGFLWSRLRKNFRATAERAGLNVLQEWATDGRAYALVGPVRR